MPITGGKHRRARITPLHTPRPFEGPDWIQTTNYPTSTLCFVTDDRYSPCPQLLDNVPGSDTVLFAVDINHLLYNLSWHSFEVCSLKCACSSEKVTNL